MKFTMKSALKKIRTVCFECRHKVPYWPLVHPRIADKLRSCAFRRRRCECRHCSEEARGRAGIAEPNGR